MMHRLALGAIVSVSVVGGLVLSDHIARATGPATLGVTRQMSDPVYEVARTTAPAESLLAGEPVPWAAASAIRWGPPRYSTEFRAVWSGAGLFVRFDAVDTNPWHTLTRRDDPLWDEEVVEVFLDVNGSGRDYAEVEISPANVVCDVRMVRPWPDKEMDLAWDLAGLESRVQHRLQRDGSTAGWMATALLPWRGFASLPSAVGIDLPPRPGDRWRFNVFRIKRPWGPERPNEEVGFLAWSPPRGSSFHDAAAFRPLVFQAP